MNEVTHECAAMAATMLDDELIAIIRKLPDKRRKTPLQQAVEKEARRRDIREVFL